MISLPTIALRLTVILLACIYVFPDQWELPLLIFTFIEVVPLGLSLLGLAPRNTYIVFGGLLGLAYLFHYQQAGAANPLPERLIHMLALPYLLVAFWYTLPVLRQLQRPKSMRLPDWLRLFAMGYWVTGALWALMFINGAQPLGFDPVIVSLTAAHFHMAGFVLTVVVYQLLQQDHSVFNQWLAKGTLLGMPAVALGITWTKLGGPVEFEMLVALAFAVMATLIAWQQFKFSQKAALTNRGKWFLAFGAGCLWVGMLLAAGYGVRFVVPVEWLSITNMKIWHGTLNTLGFAWFSLLGYASLAEQKRELA